MTDDQMYRVAIMGAGAALGGLISQVVKRKLAESRAKYGAGLPERLGRWLGRSWARTRRGK